MWSHPEMIEVYRKPCTAYRHILQHFKSEHEHSQTPVLSGGGCKTGPCSYKGWLYKRKWGETRGHCLKVVIIVCGRGLWQAGLSVWVACFYVCMRRCALSYVLRQEVTLNMDLPYSPRLAGKPEGFVCFRLASVEIPIMYPYAMLFFMGTWDSGGQNSGIHTCITSTLLGSSPQTPSYSNSM